MKVFVFSLSTSEWPSVNLRCLGLPSGGFGGLLVKTAPTELGRGFNHHQNHNHNDTSESPFAAGHQSRIPFRQWPNAHPHVISSSLSYQSKVLLSISIKCQVEAIQNYPFLAHDFHICSKTENTAVYGPLGMFQLHYSGSIFSREIRVLVRQ